MRRRRAQLSEPTIYNKYDMKTLLLLATLICGANAATLTATLDKLDPMTTSQGTFTGGQNVATYAGALEFSSPTIGSFTAFCSDPLQQIGLGETLTYNVSHTVPLSVAQVFSAYLDSTLTDLDAQAAQWAIWELLLDSNQNLSNGNVKVASGAVRDAAYRYLNTYTNYAPAEGIVMLTNPTRQDMVAVIPEPGAALLGSIGFIILLRRRR